MFNQSVQISKLFMISVQSHVYNHTKGNLNSPVNLMCLFFSGLSKETKIVGRKQMHAHGGKKNAELHFMRRLCISLHYLVLY